MIDACWHDIETTQQPKKKKKKIIGAREGRGVLNEKYDVARSAGLNEQVILTCLTACPCAMMCIHGTIRTVHLIHLVYEATIQYERVLCVSTQPCLILFFPVRIVACLHEIIGRRALTCKEVGRKEFFSRQPEGLRARASSEEGASHDMAQNLHPRLQVGILLCKNHPHRYFYHPAANLSDRRFAFACRVSLPRNQAQWSKQTMLVGAGSGSSMSL